MGSLVDDLLAFSRIGRVETQKATINLESLVRDVIAEVGGHCLANWDFADLLRRSFSTPAGVH